MISVCCLYSSEAFPTLVKKDQMVPEHDEGLNLIILPITETSE